MEAALIIVVLGMHKSGTTLVSQMLHSSGINMGDFDENISYDRGNQYEREEAFQLNLEILGAPDDEVLDLALPQNLAMDVRQREKMQAMISENQATGQSWGFKDPRTSLTYPLWAEELPPHKIVVLFRDAAQVWPRYIWAGKRLYHTNFSRAYAYVQRWQEHNLSLLKYLQETSMDYLVLNYGELMTSDQEFRRLDNFIGGGLKDLRNPQLYRSKTQGDWFFSAADWWYKKRKGCSVSETMAKLESYRP